MARLRGTQSREKHRSVSAHEGNRHPIAKADLLALGREYDNQ